MLAEHSLAVRAAALAPLTHQIMHPRHKGVKVGPDLLLLRSRGIEQVHQHGLTAPRRAPDVDAAHIGHRTEQALLRQIGFQTFQLGNQPFLSRIRRQYAFFDTDVVSTTDARGHAPPHSPRALPLKATLFRKR